jgi:hypothetical protein
MSDVRELLKKLTAFGQDLTTTSTIVPGSSAELATMYATAFHVQISKAADGAASTATTNTFMFCNETPYPMYVLSASYVSPAGTITASATDYATISVLTDNGAAGTPAAAGQRSTTIAAPGTGNVAAAIKADILTAGTITAANSTARVLVAGGILWFAIAKAGSGVVVPAGTITVTLAKF